MSNVLLQVEDGPNRLTLKVMLEADGHQIVSSLSDADVAISETVEGAVLLAKHRPTLLLASASAIPEAIRAMRQGVYGYVFLPFQPGEAPLMVQRALVHNGSAADYTTRIRPLEDLEHEHILRTLHQCKNNQVKAAKVLGIGRNTLWRKLKSIREKRPGAE